MPNAGIGPIAKGESMASKRSLSRVSLLAAMVLAWSMTLPAQALTKETRTYAIKVCHHLRYKPRRFTIKSSCWIDAGIYARQAKWRYWDRKRFGDRWARADAKIFQDDCRPFCASGHYHHRAAHVWLTGRRWCTNVDRFVYRVQHIKYVGPDIGPGPPIKHWPHGWHILGCPLP
jgi:hypothetical protein